MKHHMTGKVVGIALSKPDPKLMPEFEVAKVKVEFVTSVVDDSTGLQVALSSTGTLIVPLHHVGHRGDFALGRSITADFEDYQQELGLGRGPLTVNEVGGEFFDAETGEKLDEQGDTEVELQLPGERPVKTTLGRMRAVAEQLRASRELLLGRPRRSSSKHN